MKKQMNNNIEKIFEEKQNPIIIEHIKDFQNNYLTSRWVAFSVANLLLEEWM